MSEAVLGDILAQRPALFGINNLRSVDWEGGIEWLLDQLERSQGSSVIVSYELHGLGFGYR